jgi:hypothetical protein
MTSHTEYQNTPQIYLAEPTFSWAFEEAVTIMPHPEALKRTIEIGAVAGNYTAADITSRSLFVVMRGQREMITGIPSPDRSWDSCSDSTPFYHADELYKPSRRETRPTLKSDLAPLALRAARFELSVDAWDDTIGKQFLEQLIARRTNGTVAQIIGQEIMSSLSEAIGKQRWAKKMARRDFESEDLVPFIIGPKPGR